MIWKIRKKSQLNSENIWKIQKKIVKRYGKYGKKASHQFACFGRMIVVDRLK
jgi:hypothetical protein